MTMRKMGLNMTLGKNIMFSKLTVLFSFLLMLFSGHLYALGLGEIQLNSYLHQPFDAELDLISVRNVRLDSIKVELASDEQFIRAGIEVNEFLHSLKFKVDLDHQSGPKVFISSRRAVRDPFLDFLVTLSWSEGQLIREYTVLLDPPIIAAVIVAKKPAPAVAEKNAVIKDEPRQKPAPARKPARINRVEGDHYKSTTRLDTLWDLGKSLRTDDAVSREQMMIALWKENPRAFTKRNINGLMAGYNLRIPTQEQVLSISHADALNEIATQHNEWRGDRSKTAERLRGMQQSESGAQLKLLTPSFVAEPQLQEKQDYEQVEDKSVVVDKLVADSNNTISSDLRQVKEEIAMAAEETETQRQQTEDLQMRFSAMEEQIASLHRLIRLKDSELARLQGQATQEQGAPQDQAAIEREVVEDTGFMSASMMQALAIVVLVLLLVIYTLAKRKAAKAQSGTPVGNINSSGAATVVSATKNINTVDVDDDKSHAGAAAARVKDDLDTTADSIIAEEDQLGVDASLLAEIDVYLAYGHYQQVEQLIAEALTKDPDNNALRMKLLEMYSATQNKDSFVQEARQVFTRLGQQKNDPLWVSIKEMGSSLGVDESEYESDEAPESIQSPANIASFDVEEDTASQGNDLPEEGLEASREVKEEAVLEFKLDASLEEELDQAEASDIVVDDISVEEVPDSGSLLSSVEDEVATKLDLARAYLDMEDANGAKTLLEEAVEKGSDKQKEEAVRMLNEIK